MLEEQSGMNSGCGPGLLCTWSAPESFRENHCHKAALPLPVGLMSHLDFLLSSFFSKKLAGYLASLWHYHHIWGARSTQHQLFVLRGRVSHSALLS